MKYNLNLTQNHELSRSFEACVVDYNQLIYKEDESLTELFYFFKNVEVIDLDCVEKCKSIVNNRPRFKTMDSCFAICDITRVNMLLVELRFNYKNLKNLNRESLLGKVTGSRIILGDSIAICEKYIFVFKKDLVQQARSRLQRMIPKIPNNYIAMDLEELQNIYFE